MAMHDEVKRLMDERGISLRAIARGIGLSHNTLWKWFNGQYPGDVKKVEKKLAEYLQRQRQRARVPKAVFRWTKAARDVFEALRQAHEEQDFAVILGPSGVGKTTALRKYAEKHENVYLLEVDPTCGTKKGFLQFLTGALGGDTQGTARTLMGRAEKLLAEGDVLLIIDEAEHLSI